VLPNWYEDAMGKPLSNTARAGRESCAGRKRKRRNKAQRGGGKKKKAVSRKKNHGRLSKQVIFWVSTDTPATSNEEELGKGKKEGQGEGRNASGGKAACARQGRRDGRGVGSDRKQGDAGERRDECALFDRVERERSGLGDVCVSGPRTLRRAGNGQREGREKVRAEKILTSK